MTLPLLKKVRRQFAAVVVVPLLVTATCPAVVSGQELATITGKFYASDGLAFSPDGKQLAVPGDAGGISIWNVETATLAQQVEDHNDLAAFLDDGKTLASASIDQTILLWDVQSGQRLDKGKRPKLNCDAIAFSPDGETLAAIGLDGSVTLWDVKTGKKRAETKAVVGTEATGLNNIGYSLDGKLLVASIFPERLRIWKAQTLELRHAFDRRLRDDPFFVAANGSLSGLYGDDGIGLDESKRPDELASVRRALAPSTVAYSPDGKTLAAGLDRPEIGLWELRSGHRLATLRGPEGQVNHVAFAPDGQTLASSHGTSVLKLWDVGRAVRQKLREVGPHRPDSQKLQGTWIVVAGERNGAPFRPPYNQYRFDGNRLTIARDREELRNRTSLAGALARGTGATISVQCEYQLDDKADPGQIDWTGELSGRRFSRSAIYRVEGHTLRLCIAPDRPTGFATAPKDGRSLYVLERVSPARRNAREVLSKFRLPYELGYEGAQVVVDLSDTEITDADLVHLKVLSNLRDLQLRHTSVSGSGLAQLNDLLDFEQLDLSDTKVTDSGLDHLQGLRYLRELKLRSTTVTDAGLAALKNLPELDELDLGGTRITDDGLAILKTLPEIRYVDLSDTKVTDGGLAHLAETPTLLYRLVLDGTQITDNGLTHLTTQFNLNDLSLAGTSVTDAGLDHLKAPFLLHYVNLNGTRISDAGLAKLKEHRRLEELHLSGTRVSDAGLEHLKELEHLARLDLSDTQVTPAGLESLRKLPELSYLMLGGNRITDSDLPRLAQFARLYELDLSHTQVTDAALDSLEGLPCMRLNLKGTRVTTEGLKRLRDARYWEGIEY